MEIDNELNNLRKKIDATDDKIIELVAERMKIVKKIGEIKKKNNIEVIDSKRQSAVFEERKKKAKSLGLDDTTISNVFKLLVKNSIKEQKEILSKKK